MKMKAKYNPDIFWEGRFKKYGHTGWSDQIIYKYDQPLRLRVIKNILNKIQGSIENKKILDVGCGVGDFSIMFAKMSAEVTGIDISEKAVGEAKKKAKGLCCDFKVTSIKNMDFQKSFDIILSITVLQHIPNKDLLSSIQKLADSLNIEGYIYILETAPVKLNQNTTNSEYQHFHTRKDWIKLFEKASMKLQFEIVYPGFGLSLIRLGDNIARAIYNRFISKKNQEIPTTTTNQLILINNNKLVKIYSLFEKIIFIFSKPIDYYMPFLAKFGTTRVMVFKKVK
ncbi:MAG: class I SAM-dependent methyltransferase [Candidatus Aenigmarchaeota archaeon]|nr:class I SAM-dependent methyltransferase [Candidatus Aenigmarchaeota archaeon]